MQEALSHHPDDLMEPAVAPDALLALDRISVVRDGRAILDEFSLRIAPGQHTAILGPNGSGKSTLVKLIDRQLYPLGGASLRVFGRDRWDVTELRSLLGIVSPATQTDFTSGERLEVFNAVASGFFAARGVWDHPLTDEMRERSHEALVQAGARHLVGREMASLSTGEARRVLIARALVHRPRALLLDEPCAGLDPASRRQFLESLRALARGGTTLLLVTHHIEEILPEIGHVVMLRDGRLLQEGDKAQLLNDTALSTLFGAKARVERHGEWYWARIED